MVERAVHRLGVDEHERALAEVVQHQGRQHNREPVEPDRSAAEMAHVGVERLGPCHGEEHRAEGEESDPAVTGEKADRVQGVQRHEYARIAHNLQQPADGQHDEPRRHDRAKEGADAFTAAALHHEQTDQHDHGERDDVRLEQRRRDLQALDRAQDGDRWGDHAVAIEQRGPRDADHEQRRSAPQIGFGVRGKAK